MDKKKKKVDENIPLNEVNEEPNIEESEDINVVNEENKNKVLCQLHCDKAFTYLKTNKKEEAKKELEIASGFDENNPYVFLGKLFIKYNIKSMEDFKKKANNTIITSSFFNATYDLADLKLKSKLDKIREEVEFRYVETNIESVDLEQLLKHLRFQKQKKVDYTYTISLILQTLYREFRNLDKDYIDQNLNKENFIETLKKNVTNYQYYVDLLGHYDDISDIKDIVSQCMKEQKAVRSYLLVTLKSLIKNTDDEAELLEIKEYLELAYNNHEADELIELILPKIKKRYIFNYKKSLIAGGVSLAVVLSVIGISVGISFSASSGPVTINGITYVQNDLGGYTIAGYDMVDSTVIFEDEINNRPVNQINADVFVASEIERVIDFPNSIYEIPPGAFEGCQQLVEFDINEESLLQSISSTAFKDCINLTTIRIPKNVNYIGFSAFDNTPNLINITKDTEIDFNEENIGLQRRSLTVLSGGLDGPIQNEIYYSWDTIAIAPGEKVTMDFLGYQINDTTDDIKNEVDPETGLIVFEASGYYSITAIGLYETAGKFTDPQNGVTYELSEDKTYYSMVDFEPIDPTINASLVLYSVINDIPVKVLNEDVFKGERNISRIINLSPFIQEIPDNAFRGCVNLVDLGIGGDPYTPVELQSIGANAFEGCVSLTSFTLPATVKNIGDNAFNDCTALTTFINSYDFSWSEGETPHNEAIRIGFDPRNYTITYEDGTVLEGVYYTPETYLNITPTAAGNTRNVVIDQDGEVYAIPYQAQSYLLDFSGKPYLNLRVVSENYYDSSRYILNIVSDRAVSVPSSGGEVSLACEVTSISGEVIPGDHNIVLVVNEEETTSGVHAELVEGTTIYVSKGNEDSSGGIVVLNAEFRGSYSNETILRSTTFYLAVSFI